MNVGEQSELDLSDIMPNETARLSDTWPNLGTHYRSAEHVGEIVRAAPGTRLWEFARTIPDIVVQMVRAAPSHQWSLLEACAASPIRDRGHGLATDCPALAILLIQSWSLHKHGDRREYFRRMLVRPWRELLSELGLPVRPRTYRILQKLPIEHCHSPTVAMLGRALCRGGRGWLHVIPHMRTISRDSVSLLFADPNTTNSRRSTDPRFVNPKLLIASAASDCDDEPVTNTIRSIRTLLDELGRPGWPYSALGYEALRQVEGELHETIFRQSLVPFPEPPFAGIPQRIEPVRSFDELLLESGATNHYFTSCLTPIQEQRLYLYSVTHPERATLVIRRVRTQDAWSIHAVCLADDTDVTAQTMAFVLRWFHSVTAAGTDPTGN